MKSRAIYVLMKDYEGNCSDESCTARTGKCIKKVNNPILISCRLDKGL